MKRRWPGLLAAFVIGLIFLPALLVLLAVMGRLPSDSLAAPPGWENELGEAALEASLERRAEGLANPIAAGDEAALVAGMDLYRDNCAGCHGGARGPSAWGSNGFYPRVPQFWQEHHEHITPAEAFVAVQGRHPLFGHGRLARDAERARNVAGGELRQPHARAAAAGRRALAGRTGRGGMKGAGRCG